MSTERRRVETLGEMLKRQTVLTDRMREAKATMPHDTPVESVTLSTPFGSYLISWTVVELGKKEG